MISVPYRLLKLLCSAEESDEIGLTYKGLRSDHCLLFYPRRLRFSVQVSSRFANSVPYVLALRFLASWYGWLIHIEWRELPSSLTEVDTALIRLYLMPLEATLLLFFLTIIAQSIFVAALENLKLFRAWFFIISGLIM